MNNTYLARSLGCKMAFRASAVGFALVVAWLAFRPASDVADGLPWDKANHALAFLFLTVLTGLGWPRMSRMSLVVVMMTAGGAIELVQGLPLIGRDADVFDLLADGVGVVTGLLVIGLVSMRWRGAPILKE